MNVVAISLKIMKIQFLIKLVVTLGVQQAAGWWRWGYGGLDRLMLVTRRQRGTLKHEANGSIIRPHLHCRQCVSDE